MVLTTLLLESSSVTVTPWAPEVVATVPWFLMVAVKLTVFPAAGVLGEEVTAEGTRSELWTGVTTREVGLV